MNTDQQKLAREFVSDFLNNTTLPTCDNEGCPYLRGMTARSEGFQVDGMMSEAVYRALLDKGFRRSGRVFYHPICRECDACMPLRVPVRAFSQTKSMRRVWRKNADISVRFGDYEPDDEKHGIYVRYLDAKHDRTMSSTFETFTAFLYDSPVDTREVCYEVDGKLVGVSILDFLPGALSSVYMFFDPDYADRSLGTFSILWEIEYCRLNGLAYYYLGYYVPGSKTMAYKARFGPAEVLCSDGVWNTLAAQEE